MKAYKFEKIATDKYIFTIEKEELPFTRTVAMAKKVQSLNIRTKMKMARECQEQGISKSDYVIEKNVNGKKIQDDGWLRDVEETFRGIVIVDILEELFQECFNLSLEEMCNKLGIDYSSDSTATMNEMASISKDFLSIIIGNDKTPFRATEEAS